MKQWNSWSYFLHSSIELWWNHGLSNLESWVSSECYRFFNRIENSIVFAVTTGCPKKKYPDLVDPSDKNIAWINPKWFSKHTLIANLNIDTSFVEFGALRVKISIFKGQICLHLQTRALALWPKQILEALWMKSTKFEDGTTDVFSIIQFMWDLSSREPRNQLHSSQYRQFI